MAEIVSESYHVCYGGGRLRLSGGESLLLAPQLLSTRSGYAPGKAEKQRSEKFEIIGFNPQTDI